MSRRVRNELRRGGPTAGARHGERECPGKTTATLGEDSQRRVSVQPTPGPWLVSEFDGTTIYSGHLHTGVAACAPDPLPPPHIAGGQHFAPPSNLEERKTNARVIAAALDMREALQAFVQMEEDLALSSYGMPGENGQVTLSAEDWRDEDPEGFELVQRGKTALAKAEGRL